MEKTPFEQFLLERKKFHESVNSEDGTRYRWDSYQNHAFDYASELSEEDRNSFLIDFFRSEQKGENSK